MYISKIANNFLIIIVFILSITSCTKQQDNILGSDDQSNICIYLDGNDLKYNTDIPIAGFQFNHNGCVTGVSGGEAAAAEALTAAQGAQSTADAAMIRANEAFQQAQTVRRIAERAVEMANQNQAALRALNDKIDRMFETISRK